MQIKNKTFYFLIILLSCIMMLSSCKRSTEPLFNTSNLQLQVLDVSCTEAWLSLKAKNAYLNKTLKLYQDDSLKLEKTLTAEDSILFVEKLWPNTSYQFQVTVYDGNKVLAKSAAVTATTMDTTSHDFTWQTFELGGQGGSSSFYDVAIIDENNIWAVGEIYTADDKYNAAHWDGEKWELKKILFHTFCDHGTLIPYPARAVFFIDNTLLISSGSEITFFKNGTQIKNQCTPVSINKIWGTSSSDLYVVGNNGMIAHYNGHKWDRVQINIQTNIRDIWGGNTKDLKSQIIALASNGNQVPQDRKLILIEGNIGKILNDTGLPMSLAAIWFKPEIKYYVGGAGLFESCGINTTWKEDKSQPLLYISGIRGQSLNDIVLCGGYGHLSHFNGLNWKHFYGKALPHIEGNLNEVQIKKDLIVSVGWLLNDRAIIVLGKR